MPGVVFEAVIDTHCHLDSTRFDGDRQAVLARAFAQGVTGVVVPAVGPSAWEGLLALPASEPRVQVALGIHPQLLPELRPEDDEVHLAQLDQLLSRGGAVAVGECGLDGTVVDGAPMERQLDVLRGHFALARKHGLPLLVHCLKAHPALEALLAAESVPSAGLLLHSYSGGAHRVAFYAERGCDFSFAGPVTYPSARKTLEAVRAVPDLRLLIETDAPDQTPHPHRGERNEPAHLPLVLAAIASARGCSPGELSTLTTANARRLFARWPSPSSTSTAPAQRWR